MNNNHSDSIYYTDKVQISRHADNINNLSDNSVGVAEHPDLIETIDKEIEKICEAHDKLEVLETYFKIETDQSQKYI